jgi:hypothetical protein
VQLKPTTRSTSRRAKEIDTKDLSDILTNSIGNQLILNSIPKKRPSLIKKQKFDANIHPFPRVT